MILVSSLLTFYCVDFKNLFDNKTVTALDRANAEDALLPIPKIYLHEKKKTYTNMIAEPDEVMAHSRGSKGQAKFVEGEGMSNILSGILYHLYLPYTSILYGL